jgi:hypothetical protein
MATQADGSVHHSPVTDQPAPTQIDSWQVAERNAAAWMQSWGFTDAVVTAGGADGGIDIASGRALAQVKFEARQVGAPAVQRLVGARGRDVDKALLFFSGVGYAQPAIAYADTMDVALFKYDLLGTMAPVNGVAERMMASRPEGDRVLELSEDQHPNGRGWFGRNWQWLAGPMFIYVAIDMLLNPEAGGSRADNVGPAIVGLVLGLGMVLYWFANADERSHWKALRSGGATPGTSKPPLVVPDPRNYPDVMDPLARDALIEAVKAYRGKTGLGLAEATRAVTHVRNLNKGASR